MTTHAIPLRRQRPHGLYAICFGFFLVLFDTTGLTSLSGFRGDRCSCGRILS